MVFDPCDVTVLELADSATPAERESTAAAIALWNQVVDTGVTLSPVPQAKRLPVVFETAAPAFHGLYDDANGIVFINRQLEAGSQRTITIAHELGHAFGLPHQSADESVMSPGNLEVAPSAADGRLLLELWGPCPPAGTGSRLREIIPTSGAGVTAR